MALRVALGVWLGVIEAVAEDVNDGETVAVALVVAVRVELGVMVRVGELVELGVAV